MSDENGVDPAPVPPVSERGREFIAAVLRIPDDDAAVIRDRTPSRRRARPQAGPSAEYGAEAR